MILLSEQVKAVMIQVKELPKFQEIIDENNDKLEAKFKKIVDERIKKHKDDPSQVYANGHLNPLNIEKLMEKKVYNEYS